MAQTDSGLSSREMEAAVPGPAEAAARRERPEGQERRMSGRVARALAPGAGRGSQGCTCLPPPKEPSWEGGHVADTEDGSETRKGKDLFISCSFLS